MKNRWTIKGVLFTLLIFGCSCFLTKSAVAADTQSAPSMPFAIRRGTNISHWLSQSGRRGPQRREYFTKKDVQFLARLGFDHLRLPIDEEQMWDESGNKHQEAFDLLHNAIQWCQQSKLKVIVDLHILRSHHFNAKEKPLWTDPKEQEKFVDLWRDLSGELKRYSITLVAYELMNEAVADDPEDWNKLIAKAVSAIRKNEPQRKIVVGSNRWQSVNTFDQLRIPEGDRNIILSFHFYIPMLITHYQASWTGVGKYKGPVQYPGRLIDPKSIQDLSPDQAQIAKRSNGSYDRQRLEEYIRQPLSVAKRYNLPLYCGEWGAYEKCPREPRLNWYRDVHAVLEKNNLAWGTWDYKGGFGLVARDKQPDKELIGILMK